METPYLNQHYGAVVDSVDTQQYLNGFNQVLNFPCQVQPSMARIQTQQQSSIATFQSLSGHVSNNQMMQYLAANGITTQYPSHLTSPPEWLLNDSDTLETDARLYYTDVSYQNQYHNRLPQITLRCWDHGCNGREFASRSNLARHQKERSNAKSEFPCMQCGAIFSRTTALNQHVVNQSCTRIRRFSNGRERLMPKVRPSKKSLPE